MVSIRDFTLADHDELVEVARESWLFAYSSRYSPEAIDAKLADWYSVENHEAMVRRREAGTLQFKVWTADGLMQGYLAGDFPSATLLRLYVRPAMTRGGIGSALLWGFFGELKKRRAEKCLTFCDRGNAVGLGFYEKHGFRKMGMDEEDWRLEKTWEPREGRP